MDDDATCQFGRYDREGNPIEECHRTDYTVVCMDVNEYVRLCPKHRSWGAALGKSDA